MTSAGHEVRMTSTPHEALRLGVELAGHAPSLYNAQPWSWALGTDTAALSMDPTRSFPVTDPDNREMTIGCGAAVHHLQVALAASGWRWELEHGSGLYGEPIARVRVLDACEPDDAAGRMLEAIPRRRTDRRPFSEEGVGDEVLAELQSSVDSEDVHLQILTRAEQRIWLSVLSARADELQTAQVGYAEELAAVTGSLDASAAVPPAAVPHVVSPRRSDVSLRDFELSNPGSLRIAESAAEHPTWCILWTEVDDPPTWMETGVALSKLLLSATAAGLSTGVQSQPIEVPVVRAQINDKLLSNMGYAQVLIRVGWPGTGTSPPLHPRRG